MSDKQKLPSRRRNIHLHFCVDEEERDLIRDRMAYTGVTGFGAFARKMLIDGYNVNIDLTDMREMVRLLRNATGNGFSEAYRTLTRDFYLDF